MESINTGKSEIVVNLDEIEAEKAEKQKQEAEWQLRLNSFLHDLRGVFEKHALQIDGCGCCDSPYLEAATPEQIQESIERWRKMQRRYGRISKQPNDS